MFIGDASFIHFFEKERWQLSPIIGNAYVSYTQGHKTLLEMISCLITNECNENVISRILFNLAIEIIAIFVPIVQTVDHFVSECKL